MEMETMEGAVPVKPEGPGSINPSMTVPSEDAGQVVEQIKLNRNKFGVSFADDVVFTPRAQKLVAPQAQCSVDTQNNSHRWVAKRVESQLNAQNNPTQMTSGDALEIPSGRMCNLSQTELEVWEQQFAKSVKADDAATPIHLWDMRVWRVSFHSAKVTAFHHRYGTCPLNSLRSLLLQRWQRNVCQSFLKFLKA
jgi:hypothetical protein